MHNSSLKTHPQYPRPPPLQLQHRNPKQPIRPTEPTPTIHPLVPTIHALMHKPQIPRTPQQHAQIRDNLVVVLARQDRHDVRHGPDLAGQGVHAPNTRDDRAAGEVRVVAREDFAACVEVDWVAGCCVAQPGGTQQAWDIRVVHADVGAVAVDFEGVDFAEFGVVDECMVEDAAVDACGHGAHPGR